MTITFFCHSEWLNLLWQVNARKPTGNRQMWMASTVIEMGDVICRLWSIESKCCWCLLGFCSGCATWMTENEARERRFLNYFNAPELPLMVNWLTGYGWLTLLGSPYRSGFEVMVVSATGSVYGWMEMNCAVHDQDRRNALGTGALIVSWTCGESGQGKR